MNDHLRNEISEINSEEPSLLIIQQCPKCGSLNMDIETISHGGLYADIRIVCKSCYLKGEYAGELNDAIRNWNRSEAESGAIKKLEQQNAIDI